MKHFSLSVYLTSKMIPSPSMTTERKSHFKGPSISLSHTFTFFFSSAPVLQDELRARRARAAAERDWRRKQKEKAEKRAADDGQLKQARLQQVVHKEHLLAMEAGRLKAEFERELRSVEEGHAHYICHW